jgi:surfactin synthase thioesterase subunit
MERAGARRRARARLLFVPGIGGESADTRRLVEVLSERFEVEVFHTPSVETPCARISPIVELTEAIAARARGAEVLAGYSAGGVLAHEAACLLAERGAPPACVALFDSTPGLVDSRPFYFPRET